MADGTKIEWTDATWNVITGCSVLSPGCTHCYAMKLAGTRLAHLPSRAGLTIDTKAGPVWTGEVRFNEQWLADPLRWRRPRMIFVCAHGDLFHEAVPDEWIDRVFAVMALASWHTFQVLTKRPARMRAYMTDGRLRARIYEAADHMAGHGSTTDLWPLPNVWLGVSAEDQQRADERIPHLLATPAAVRWVSAEPLLGAMDLGPYLSPHFQSEDANYPKLGELDWVVVGGESGPGARPMHPDWARAIRDDCKAAGVPFFFKQWGEWHPCEIKEDGGACYAMEGHAPFNSWKAPIYSWDWSAGWNWRRLGKKAAGRLLDGELHDAMPDHRPRIEPPADSGEG